MAAAKGRPYKELTMPQLRSFCQVAQLQSLKAAADALALSHPTVWQQVHALERDLGVKLVETRSSGCQLTTDGRLLAEIATPMVAGFESVKRAFARARDQALGRLVVAAPLRTLVDDLPRPLAKFASECPNVQLSFHEVGAEHVTGAVEAGQADIGVTSDREPDPANPRLEFTLAYELDLILVTHRDHPLAGRRRVGPRDLLSYPLVNAPRNIPDPAINAALDKLGAFRTGPRRVEARYTATIRRLVEMGFGIGLVVGLPSRTPESGLHERSMSQHFGRIPVNFVWRRGAVHPEYLRRFVAIVQGQLGRRSAPKQGEKA